MRERLLAILGLLGALALVLGGCGSDSDEDGCTPGATKCEGNTVMVCDASGTFAEQQVCEEGFFCMDPHEGAPVHHCMPEGETMEEGGEAAMEEGGEAAVEEGGEAATEEGGEAATEEGGEAATEEGGEAATEEGGEAATEEGGEAATEEGGEAATEEGGEAATEEGGEAATEEGGEAATEEGGEAATEEGGEAATEEGGEAATEEGGEEATTEEGGEAVVEEGGESTEAIGACTNEADNAIVDSIDVQGVLNDNALACLDIFANPVLDADCLLEKLTEQTGLGSECAQCFVDTALCGAEFCQLECMDGGDDCIECSTEAGCTAELEACSGLQQ